ncbi:MAG: hypothetical protein ABSE16_13765 [Verrucomicrobiota bacterium]
MLARELAAFVHPVWVDDDRHNPQLVGSCALLFVGKGVFLLTAAHVLDENTGETLFLVTPTGPVLVEGEKHVSISPSCDPQHNDDPYDVGVISLNAANALALSSLPALHLNQCKENAKPMPGALYFACGYPWTKNRKVDVRRAKVPRRPFAYFTKTYPPAIYQSLGRTWGVHFVVEYNKRHVIRNGRDVTGPDLPGVSGGLLWHTNGAAHQVVGIITGWPAQRNRTKSIIASHIHFVLRAIQERR